MPTPNHSNFLHAGVIDVIAVNYVHFEFMEFTATFVPEIYRNVSVFWPRKIYSLSHHSVEYKYLICMYVKIDVHGACLV